ncbi:unnamed protein product [Didymodactylos carnosus]|uniref:NAD(P)(+)--arginine ADP-ribosyltransferase n=1 Tax=Didymodactylos carnosus TaxID=1234261 RepID=A0A815TRH3_9BILA|nr:unnamed protein product [Didymodactylos carnosus]CAF1510213.1 unnamed protein product [Didymodactylos carnosus]CAF4171607.1 unnamed protein product [Didymodactylos carnosus]CAF4371027.1 unnamed protein product [Didymodactylos carnosus]
MASSYRFDLSSVSSQKANRQEEKKMDLPQDQPVNSGTSPHRAFTDRQQSNSSRAIPLTAQSLSRAKIYTQPICTASIRRLPQPSSLPLSQRTTPPNLRIDATATPVTISQSSVNVRELIARLELGRPFVTSTISSSVPKAPNETVLHSRAIPLRTYQPSTTIHSSAGTDKEGKQPDHHALEQHTSLLASAVTSRNDYPLASSRPTLHASSAPDKTEDVSLETPTLVWLDRNVNDNEENVETQRKLRRIMYQLQAFDNIDKFEEYLRNRDRNIKVTLIISDSFGREQISHIHRLEELSALYVFTTSGTKRQDWAREYEKVQGVFTKPNDLIKQLVKHRKICEEAATSTAMNFYSHSAGDTSNTNLESRNASFLWFQLFIDILLKMSHSCVQDEARKDLIDLLKDESAGNDNELAIVDEYDSDYRAERAIWWYTRETCFYRILNKALRIFDFEVIFAMRSFLRDVSNQLEEEHKRFLRNYSGNRILRVYRGQGITDEELHLLRQNIGGFISMNAFLSTSLSKNVAIGFAKQMKKTPKFSCMLYQFEIDTRLPNCKPFAAIKHLSYIRGEDEVLIALGSIFRIEQITYDEQQQFWIGSLSLCDEDSYILKDILAQLKEEVGEDMIALGYMLNRQGDFEKARGYFQHLLNEPSISDFDAVHCYLGLGAAEFNLEDYQEALASYDQALKLIVKNNIDDQESIAVTYRCIGEVYQWKNELDLALKYEKEALSMLPDDHPELAKIYSIIANIYNDKNPPQLHSALRYQEKVLEIRQRLLHEHHPDIGVTWNNIGAIYTGIGNYEKALDAFMKSLEIKRTALPPGHPDTVDTEMNIDTVRAKMNEDEYEDNDDDEEH